MTMTAVIAVNARPSRTTAHTRLRLRRPFDTVAVSGGGPAAPDVSSADFTALTNRSSISLLGTKLGLGYAPLRQNSICRSDGILTSTSKHARLGHQRKLTRDASCRIAHAHEADAVMSESASPWSA